MAEQASTFPGEEQATGAPAEPGKGFPGQGLVIAVGAGLLGAVLLAGLAFGKGYWEYGLAGLGGLALIWCYFFRPFWYFLFLFPAIMSWSYTTYLKSSDVSQKIWMDKYSPWILHVGFMPLADTLVLLLFLRVVLDPRFAVRHRRHPLDRAVLVYLLAFPIAAAIGLMHRNATTQTMTIWALGVRVPVLMAVCYLLASRLIRAEWRQAPGRFLFAPFIGLTGAMFGAAYRGLVLHQLMDRGGTPILLVSEANMLPVMATVGVVLLCAYNIRWPLKLAALFAVFGSLAVLLTSTRREILLMVGVSVVVMFFYMPRALRRRFVIGAITMAVGGGIMILVFLQVSGKIGQLWEAFMTGSGGATTQSADFRKEEIHNIVANLDKYGGWVFGEGLGRRWERILPQVNLYGGEGFGEDAGHVWLYAVHVPFLHNLLDQGLFGLGMMFSGLFLVYKIGYQVTREPVRGGQAEVLNRALLAGLLAGLLVCMTRLFGFPNVGLFAGSLLGACDVLIWQLGPRPEREEEGLIAPPGEEREVGSEGGEGRL
jgi:hypothetical protein